MRVNNEVMGKANFVAKYLTQCAIKRAMILNDNVKADLTLGSDHLRPIVQIWPKQYTVEFLDILLLHSKPKENKENYGILMGLGDE